MIMKRTREESFESDSDDSYYEPGSGSLQDSPFLHERASQRKRKLAATNGPVELCYNNVLQLDRPRWPANNEVTPEMSLRKIRELETGNVDEKLMACFSRHVIKPGIHVTKRAGCWVSNRSLRHAFSEHFNHDGFHPRSTWKQRKAGDFGLPDLFLRGVDKRRALLRPHESVKDLAADTGHAPDVKELTGDEYERLERHGLLDEQDSSINAEQSVAHEAQGVQNEAELHAGDDAENIAYPSEHPQAISTVGLQSRRDAEAPAAILDITPSRDLTLPIKAEPMESLRPEHRTPSHQPKLSTPRTTGAEADCTRTAMPHSAQDHQEQASTTSEPVQSARSPSANNMVNIKTTLIPRLCDIIKDFPTAPDNEKFLHLLRELVKATAANVPEDIEGKFVDLSIHVYMHCTSIPTADQMDTASLLRPVVVILSRHRHQMAADTYSLLQRGLSDAARANDLTRLRAIHVQLLLLEAQHEIARNSQ